jgi:histidyl-tRNA synthetase
MARFKAPRGVPDVLPPTSELFSEVESLARRLFESYGYRRIETPVFEHTDLFARTAGESSDVIVQKQMFTFPDARGRSLTLRPEGTAGVVRAYVEHHPDQTLGSPVRLWYSGPFFRYERPAKGVDRQYFSVGVECIGSASPVTDAEVIALSTQFFSAAGLSPQLQLNTIGCPEDRKRYFPALREALEPYIDEMDDDCHRRLETNPMRVFDCKVPHDRKIVREHAPTIREYICAECKEHFAAVESMLEALGIAWTDAPDLVRGLDYYTRTVFEYVVPNFPSPGGGGRYDLLVEELGGPTTPATGFGLGLSRTVTLLSEGYEPTWYVDAHVVWLEGLAEIAMATAMDLRRVGLRVTMSDEARSLRSQLREADRLSARRAVILGPDEFAKRVATVRDLGSGEQREIALDALARELKP